MRVLHVVTNLEVGGAQVMLRRVVERLQARGLAQTVTSLAARGPVGEALQASGVSVEAIGMTRSLHGPAAMARLARLMSAVRPDVVQTWLYHADLVGGLAARAVTSAPVVWGVHHVPKAGEPLRPSTRAVLRANTRLAAWLPARIVCCAEAARDAHRAIGYPVDRMVVIPNGVDTAVYRPDGDARQTVRASLGLDPGAELVTMVARVHPHKDHRTFLEAAGALAARRPGVHVLLAGEGVDSRRGPVAAWVAQAGLEARVHLLGPRADVARLMAASDVVALASRTTEALPLVLLEAMACATPCVATDVGDAARLIGDTGHVVPVGAVGAFAAALEDLLSSPGRAARGQAARARVEAHYGLDACAAAYEACYAGVAAAAGEGRQ